MAKISIADADGNWREVGGSVSTICENIEHIDTTDTNGFASAALTGCGTLAVPINYTPGALEKIRELLKK